MSNDDVCGSWRFPSCYFPVPFAWLGLLYNSSNVILYSILFNSWLVRTVGTHGLTLKAGDLENFIENDDGRPFTAVMNIAYRTELDYPENLPENFVEAESITEVRKNQNF